MIHPECVYRKVVSSLTLLPNYNEILWCFLSEKDKEHVRVH